MQASRLRISRILSPASTTIRVFSVATRAAFPELPLASTQNLTMSFSPELQEYTEYRQNKIVVECSNA